MTTISALSLGDLKGFQDRLAEEAKECDSLEAAAQLYTSRLYERWCESIILARFFATIPYGELPPPNQAFVRGLVSEAGFSEQLQESTAVLSLLGTSGSRTEWNDRRVSKGHVGIPLASVDFIESIPMMSRLLKQLGAGLDWIKTNDTGIVVRTIGRTSGVFYVREARTEVDVEGRKVIVAQDFVKDEDVHTVFGVGGGYLGSPIFFTTIIFLRETVDRETVERFNLMANKFKTATMGVVFEGKIFGDS